MAFLAHTNYRVLEVMWLFGLYADIKRISGPYDNVYAETKVNGHGILHSSAQVRKSHCKRTLFL